MVRDLPVVPETWFDHYLVRDGVAIDRDTETAAEGLKYDFEAVPSGVGFRFEMVIENASDAELGLALLGLREFEMGNVALGGAASRGLGSVKLALDWAQSEWVTATNLRAYFAEQSVERLQEESQRAQYWNAFLAALDQGKEV